MNVFNFEHSAHKSDLDAYCGSIVFLLLKKPAGKHYLEVFRILVPPEILVPVASNFCLILEALLMFQILISKGDVEISYTATISSYLIFHKSWQGTIIFVLRMLKY